MTVENDEIIKIYYNIYIISNDFRMHKKKLYAKRERLFHNVNAFNTQYAKLIL